MGAGPQVYVIVIPRTNALAGRAEAVDCIDTVPLLLDTPSEMGSSLLTHQKAARLFAEDKPAPGLEWVTWLRPHHMRLFAVELHETLSNPSPERLAQLLEAWEATAELDRTPDVQRQLERNRSAQFDSIDEWLKTRHTA